MSGGDSSPLRGEVPGAARGWGLRRGLVAMTLIAAAGLLVWWGWFVLGFLDEPSAVDRVRAALIMIGGGSIAAGFAGAAAVPLSGDEVRHVAMLARIGLEAGDEEFYAGQLSGILEHIDRLQQLDTEDIPPTAQVVEIASRLRDDEPRPSLTQEEALANAPAAVNGLFRVPSIQEET